MLELHGLRIRVQRSATFHRNATTVAVDAVLHVLAGGWKIRESIVHHHQLHQHKSCVVFLVGILRLGLATTNNRSGGVDK